MDIVSNIIENNIKQPEGSKRIKYMPYSENIAKNVWNEIATQLIGPVKYDEFNKKVWSELIKYVHADEMSEYNLDKSIALVGRTGSGKTKTMQIMSRYINVDKVKYLKNGKLINFNYRIISSREIVNEYSMLGYDGLQKYNMLANICIDDFGSEIQSAKYYGTELNVIEELIETRYSKGLITHLTSNLDLEDILETYGSRVHSRLIQSCNIITLNGKDYRLT